METNTHTEQITICGHCAFFQDLGRCVNRESGRDWVGYFQPVCGFFHDENIPVVYDAPVKPQRRRRAASTKPNEP